MSEIEYGIVFKNMDAIRDFARTRMTDINLMETTATARSGMNPKESLGFWLGIADSILAVEKIKSS
jgi:hypothetical protein